MSAHFKGLATLPSPVIPRVTPHGDHYNYDDGYVLNDVSGSANGQSWYWGYDNSASQISGNTVLLSRTTVTGSSPSTSSDSDVSPGFEVVYHRWLNDNEKFRYGIEAAFNWQSLSASSSFNTTRGLTRVTDAYPFVSQTTPPTATPDNPYQGSFTGPGFVIGTTPVGSSSVDAAGSGTISGHRSIDSDLWGFRFGPYFEVPLNQRITVALSAGLSVALIDASGSWTETVSVNGNSGSAKGSGNDVDALGGAFISATLSWQLNPHWSIVGGGQFQSLADYKHTFSGQKVELSLSNGLFATLGVGFAF
jgi:hypothetical protein